jgi:hypothetical protein
MIEEIGKMVDKYIDHNSNWTRTQTDYCENQGCEVVWRNKEKGWSIIHCQNYKTSGCMSIHSPLHVWKIGGTLSEERWTLCLTYGIAPY